MLAQLAPAAPGLDSVLVGGPTTRVAFRHRLSISIEAGNVRLTTTSPAATAVARIDRVHGDRMLDRIRSRPYRGRSPAFFDSEVSMKWEYSGRSVAYAAALAVVGAFSMGSVTRVHAQAGPATIRVCV